VGGASLVSRALGARRPDLAGRAAGNSFAIFWATAVAVTIVGLAFLDPLLRLVGATAETLPYARPYATVIVGGAIFSTGFSALVRAEGRLLFSMMLWVVPVIVQITLDPLLIFGLDMGVVGAGLGTVGGQAVSAAMSVWFFFVQRRRPYRIGFRQLLPHGPTVRSVLAVGAPSFLAGFGATLLAVLVNTTLAVAGAAVIAAYAVCARVQTFVSMPQTGITQGTQPIVSFNAGRRQFERVRRTRALALGATVVYGATAAAVVALAARPIAGAFLTDPGAVAFTVDALRILSTGFVFAGVAPLVSAYFQALGSPAPSYLISVGTLLLLKVPLVLALGALGPLGIWIALPAGEALAATAAVVILRWRAAQERPPRPGPGDEDRRGRGRRRRSR
jgi:putative MATE family efflux protein